MNAKLYATNKNAQFVSGLMMPLMTLVFAFMMPSSMGLYWAAGSLFSCVQDVLLNKHFNKVLDAEDAVNIQRRRAREAELEALVNELTDESTEEEHAAVELETAAFEAQCSEADKAENENEEAQVNLQTEIDGLERELNELNERATVQAQPAASAEHRDERKAENMNKFFSLTPEQTRDFFNNDGVVNFLTEVRASMAEKRAIKNAGLLIPDTMLGLVREEIARQSKLLPFINLRRVGGTSRMNIMGKVPEAVWTEMCANINQIDLTFAQTEVDGYKVGAAVVVCNALLEDSDIALASEIISAIGTAIAKALDKAILFGTGTKMPIGIATRLAASSQPAWWGTNEPEFTDLHTSNVQTLNIYASSGAAFMQALVLKLGIAKDVYNQGGLFWVMNRKTHLDIMAKCLAFDAAAALVSNTNLFPVVGGTIIEMEDDELADYEIIGGFGGNYLMAERAGIQLASSSEYLFLQDQTAYKGTARYDGKPLAGEAFVIVNYNNQAPTTSKDFAPDDANAVTELRLNTDTAAITGTGTYQLKAITAPGKGTVTWTSGTTAKATVSSTGLVTGVTAGTSLITASCNGLTASCVVTVS